MESGDTIYVVVAVDHMTGRERVVAAYLDEDRANVVADRLVVGGGQDGYVEELEVE